MKDILDELDRSIRCLKEKQYQEAKKSLIRAVFYSKLGENNSSGERYAYYYVLTGELEARILKLEKKYMGK